MHFGHPSLLALLFTHQSATPPIRHRPESVPPPRPLVSIPWRACIEAGRLVPRVVPHPVSTRGAVGLVNPISGPVSVSVRPIRSIPRVAAVRPAVVSAPIRAPLRSPMNACNAHWGKWMSNHRAGVVQRQRHASLRRDAKRVWSCTQNASAECGHAGSHYFQHDFLLSKLPPRSPNHKDHIRTLRGRFDLDQVLPPHLVHAAFICNAPRF
jgi:hypothetical protein